MPTDLLFTIVKEVAAWFSGKRLLQESEGTFHW